MNLFIMRHGQASFDAPTDELRELDEEGILQVTNASNQFDLAIDKIIVSPYVRAQQTCQIFNNERNLPVEVSDLLIPEANVLKLIDQLTLREEKSILLIGHNPIFSYLANQLTLEDRFSLATASIVHLQGEIIATGCMSLVKEYHQVFAL